MLKRIFASLAILVTLASAVSIAQDWQPKYVTADQADIKPFHYSATVTDVYDGDTITVRVDLGFNVTISLRLRLHGIDTWELRGVERPQGLVARDWLRSEILGKTITFVSFRDKTGKYGRYLALIYSEGHQLSINDRLVKLGHGVYKDY